MKRKKSSNLHASFCLNKRERDYLEIQVVPDHEVHLIRQLKSSIQVLEEYRLFLKKREAEEHQVFQRDWKVKHKIFIETDFADVLEVLYQLSGVFEAKEGKQQELMRSRHMARELKVGVAAYTKSRFERHSCRKSSCCFSQKRSWIPCFWLFELPTKV